MKKAPARKSASSQTTGGKKPRKQPSKKYTWEILDCIGAVEAFSEDTTYEEAVKEFKEHLGSRDSGIYRMCRLEEVGMFTHGGWDFTPTGKK